MTEYAKQLILDIILREGELSNNKRDKGGCTKYGISTKSYPNIPIKDITIADAIEIYHRDYYLASKCYAFPKEFQPVYLDSCVLHGIGWTRKALKTALKCTYVQLSNTALGFYSDKGIKTLINLLVDLRINLVNRIVEKHPEQNTFIHGWIDRINSFRLE